MSLRFRLNLLITILLLIFMSAVGYVIVKGMKSSIQEGVEAATRVTVQLLDTVIVVSVQNPQYGLTHDVMNRFLRSLGHVRSNTITLYDIDHQVLYISPPSKYRSNESPPEWFMHFMAPKKETVTRRIRLGMLTVESNPRGALSEAWAGFSHLMWIGASFFLLLNLAVYWMLGRWLKPLQTMQIAMNQLEKGDLTARLPDYSSPEFDKISHHFNSMGSSLQVSTDENRKLALIVRQAAEAIMIHDLEGNISFWNPAAQKMFGFSADEIIGMSAEKIIAESGMHELKQNLALTAAGQSVDHYDTQRMAKNGRLIDVSLSASPLIDPTNNMVIGDICIMRDITERKLAEIAEKKLEETRLFTQVIQKHIEDERRSLARELHDELGQYVTAIKTFAVAIANKAKTQMPEVEASANVIVGAANQIYDGMHNIIRQLRPGSLDNLGLSETLKDAVNGWQKQNPNLQFHLKLQGKLDSLGETVNINIYRIVQEAVTNAIKHSAATQLDITLKADKLIQLTIKDDGVGMNIDEVDQTQHFGLLGIRERAQALNGVFDIVSQAGQGTMISVTMPIRI